MSLPAVILTFDGRRHCDWVVAAARLIFVEALAARGTGVAHRGAGCRIQGRKAQAEIVRLTESRQSRRRREQAVNDSPSELRRRRVGGVGRRQRAGWTRALVAAGVVGLTVPRTQLPRRSPFPAGWDDRDQPCWPKRNA